jgi:hypothetical protein
MLKNSNELKEYKKKLSLSPLQREILIGVILGDAHLRTQNHGKTFSVHFSQSDAHKPYLDHLYHIFKD